MRLHKSLRLGRAEGVGGRGCGGGRGSGRVRKSAGVRRKRRGTGKARSRNRLLERLLPRPRLLFLTANTSPNRKRPGKSANDISRQKNTTIEVDADHKEFVSAVGRSQSLHHPWVSPPNDAASFGRFVDSQSANNQRFLLRNRHNEELVGVINISEIVRGVFQSGYLGYYIFAPYENQGLMTEGLTLVLRKAFSDLKLHRLEANIQPENLASIALVKSCGLRKEGFSPRYLKINGRWKDHERWAILAEDSRNP